MSIFPENISTYGEAIDSLALVITVAVSVGFFIAMGLLCYSMVKFRRRQGTKAAYLTGTTWHQLRWVLIPTLIILGVDLFIDWRTHDVWNLIKQYVPPTDVAVRITGQQFAWVFTYPDAQGNFESPDAFKSMNALHVPVGKNVVFDLEAKDVLHSFWVPALRLKQDSVPGRTIKGWFQATKVGKYDIGCAQICGTGHTNMHASLIVESIEDFQKWVANKGQDQAVGTQNEDPVAHGKLLTQQRTCVACHSIDGSKLVGPTYKGLYQRKEVVVTNGAEREIIADEEYIRRSIKEPNADIVKGYPPGMPPLGLTDAEINDIIEYLKTLK